jgi:hypothetical protein
MSQYAPSLQTGQGEIPDAKYAIRVISCLASACFLTSIGSKSYNQIDYLREWRSGMDLARTVLGSFVFGGHTFKTVVFPAAEGKGDGYRNQRCTANINVI